MTHETLPTSLCRLLDVVTPVLARTYDVNAERFDPLIGDDMQTFAFNVYRHSWYLIEEVVKDLDGWTSSRPDGSLLLTDGHYRVHVYRAGANELVDLETFRFDTNADSITKRTIASSNSAQMAFEFEYESARDAVAAAARNQSADLCEIVLLHAGNPEDTMCAVWTGAPVASGVTSASPWAWTHTEWRTDRPGPATATREIESATRHDEMPEPDLDLGPAVQDESAADQS